MSPALSELCLKVRELDVSGFELSDDIEELALHAESHKELLSAIADRVVVDPSFRDDLCDLGILQVIMDNKGPEIDSLEDLSRICGSHRGLRMVIGSSQMVNVGLFEEVSAMVLGCEFNPSAVSFATMLCSGITANKKRFLGFVPELISLLSVCLKPICSAQIELLICLLADDDKINRSDPCIVMTRNTLMEQGKNFVALRNIVMLCRDSGSHTLTLSLIDIMSCSNAYSYMLAIDDGHLKWVMDVIHGLRVLEQRSTALTCIKIIRTWSFSDDLKELILARVIEEYEQLLVLANSSAPATKHVFATLANLSLRNPDVALTILNQMPYLEELINKTMRVDAFEKSRTPCMQFLRTLVRSEDGRYACSDLCNVFDVMITDPSLKDCDRRLVGEIMGRLKNGDISSNAATVELTGN